MQAAGAGRGLEEYVSSALELSAPRWAVAPVATRERADTVLAVLRLVEGGLPASVLSGLTGFEGDENGR